MKRIPNMHMSEIASVTDTHRISGAAPLDAGGSPLLLHMRAIDKSFPGVVALNKAWLNIREGEVHAIVGQNGAGKSTLIKIITGAYRRDGGEVIFDGKPVSFGSTHQAQVAGISTIFQEINLVPFRSIAENIFMGREPRRFGFLNWRKMNADSAQILGGLGVHVDVKQPLMNLNVALQQMVAIARAVSFQSRLVIMDEPTSSLDEREVDTLFDVIRRLKQDGVSVIYISHRLDELHQIGDRITIMRDGETIEESPLSELTKLEIVSKMLGKAIGEISREGATGFKETKKTVTSEPVVRAEHLRRGRNPVDVSIDVRPGEIVGMAGLLGSGRTETARILFGADQAEGGSVMLKGQPISFSSPREAIKSGMGYCSEDRKAEGIIPFMSVRENLTLAAMPVLSRHGIVDREEQTAIVDRFISLLSIKVSDPNQEIRQLSGGNQQKVLLARWLCLNPEVLLLDEPTRGIDVGAKAEIHALIESLADEGLAVLMITSEIEEIVEGSDRVFVLRDGRTVAEFGADQITQDTIITVMAEGHENDDSAPEDKA
ncbi:MAG: sugar ABC transporter ATP-binding protein [Thermomicrobiales bacterium]